MPLVKCLMLMRTLDRFKEKTKEMGRNDSLAPWEVSEQPYLRTKGYATSSPPKPNLPFAPRHHPYTSSSPIPHPQSDLQKHHKDRRTPSTQPQPQAPIPSPGHRTHHPKGALARLRISSAIIGPRMLISVICRVRACVILRLLHISFSPETG